MNTAQQALEERDLAPLQTPPSPEPLLLARPRRRRWPVWLALLALLAGAGGYGLYTDQGADAKAGVQYRTAALVCQDVVKQVTATGTLTPLVKVAVGSQVSGRIQELLVDYNGVVKKGQVIARLDSRLY